MNVFNLHPDLEKGGIVVGDLRLSRLLLLNDARYPWTVLVPRREGLTELFDLPPEERGILMEEIASVARAMSRLFSADKMNVGALGNITPQLHIHVVARRSGDDAWPGPVWGRHAPLPYPETELTKAVALVRGNAGLNWVD